MASRIVEVIEKYPASCNRIECMECDGIGRGHRRTLTEGEYVLIEKVDGEWPEAVVRKMAAAWINSPHPTLGHQIIDGLDALAGGES